MSIDVLAEDDGRSRAELDNEGDEPDPWLLQEDTPPGGVIGWELNEPLPNDMIVR